MSGGQYSLVRIVAGLALLMLFVGELLYGALRVEWARDPFWNFIVAEFGAIASLLFIFGYRDKIAAILLLIVLGPAIFGAPGAWIFFRLVYIWIFLQHLIVPAAPFGSMDARGREDPAGDWRYVEWLRPISWGLASIASVVAVVALRDFIGVDWYLPVIAAASIVAIGAPMFLWRSARALAWLILVLMLIAAILIGSNPEVSPALLLMLLLFEAHWLKAQSAANGEYLFYDGNCALCHGLVRLVLAESQADSPMRFAPLGSAKFSELVSDDTRKGLPDSVVLRTANGTLLTRSDAILSILRKLGGLWQVLALVFGLFPRTIRDCGYDFIAKIRYKFFGKKATQCPIIPQGLRERFDL